MFDMNYRRLGWGKRNGSGRKIVHAEDLFAPAAVCDPVLFLAYIDQINVEFRSVDDARRLNISAGDYGFALGTFYWGCFLFEVPSNVILEKAGRGYGSPVS